MCGIVGYIGYRPNEVIKYSLKAVEYRGYDSVGYYDGSIVKRAGKVDDLIKNINSVNSPFIAHTRWATHGKVEDKNAHPHKYGKIVLVHNGTVNIEDNFPNLTSDTDTEKIAAVINTYYEELGDMMSALNKLLKSLDGTYSLAIINLDHPNRIYFVRRGTPLIIGLGEKEIFISSDIIAFLPYTNKYIRLEDKDYGYIELDKYIIENIEGNAKRKINVFNGDYKAAILGDYPHFMLKEINEQLFIVEDIKALDIEQVKAILSSNRIDGVAAGSSYNALLFLRYLTNYDFIPYISSEYPYLIQKPKYVFAISQSGETIDTIKAVELAKARGAKIISLTNYLSSTLASISNIVIPMNAGIEIGVAATKTFLSQILFGYRLIDRYDEKAIKSAIERGLKAKIIELESDKNIFFVGKGINYPIAMEGALKLKEITYLAAEAFAAGEMKHGPLSLFDENSQTIFIHGNDISYESAINNYKEIEARGSKVFRIGPEMLGSEYFHIAAIVYLQRLAYNMAIKLGRDPDKPRFLAKAVTVE